MMSQEFMCIIHSSHLTQLIIFFFLGSEKVHLHELFLLIESTLNLCPIFLCTIWVICAGPCAPIFPRLSFSFSSVVHLDSIIQLSLDRSDLIDEIFRAFSNI